MKTPLSLLAAATLALCGALCVPLGALAQSAAPTAAQAAASDTQVHSFTLKNGMTLWVRPDRRSPTAVHMVWLRVGSMDEVDGLSGLAHIQEHMMFKGTPTVKAGEFSRRVAAMGGRENAFTSYDYTAYFQTLPANRLHDAMKLEADRFAHNAWPDDEFKREIEVIKEERRMRTEDNPRSQLFETLMSVAYSAAPYRRPVIGWMGDLDSMTAQDARSFHQQWYTPTNAAVVVVGDVDVNQVKQWAEDLYGRIPAHALPVRKPREEPLQRGIRRVELKAPAEQAVVTLGYKVPHIQSATPSAEADDALALTVLAAVLDGYPGARLDRALTQGPNRVADSVGAGAGLTGRGPQLFILEGVPAAGKTVDEVERGLRAEVQRVATDGVSEAELTRVKTQWLSSQVFKRDSVFNQARELGTAWALGLPPDWDDQVIERLQKVTAAQVQAVAKKYFGDDQLTVAVLRPQPIDPNAPKRRPPAGARH